jgi:hypothetical protein
METKPSGWNKALAVAFQVSIFFIIAWLVRAFATEHGRSVVFMNETVAEVQHDFFSSKLRWDSNSEAMPAAYDILCGPQRTNLSKGKTYIVEGRMREAWGEDACLEVLAIEERPQLPDREPNVTIAVAGEFEPFTSGGRPYPQKPNSSGATELLLHAPLFSDARLMEEVEKTKFEKSLRLQVCGTVALSAKPANVRVSLNSWNQKSGCYEWSRIIVSEPPAVYRSRLGDF